MLFVVHYAISVVWWCLFWCKNICLLPF